MIFNKEKEIDAVSYSKELFRLYRFCNSVIFFEAYFDESGIHDGSPIVTVGGALAQINSWDRIIDKWAVVLSNYNITSLHTSDLNSFKGQFKNWNEEKKRKFTNDILKIVKNGELILVGSAVNMPEFDIIMKEFQINEITAYKFLIEHCIRIIRDIGRAYPEIKPIAITFEAGQKSKCPFIDACLDALKYEDAQEEFRIKQISFLTKEDNAIPLQVADFIAYEAYKHHCGFKRYPLTQISSNLQAIGKKFKANYIRQWAEKYKLYIQQHPDVQYK